MIKINKSYKFCVLKVFHIRWWKWCIEYSVGSKLMPKSLKSCGSSISRTFDKYWMSIAESWQGGICEGRPGLSHVGYSCFQTVPMDPPQGTAEPIRKAGGASEKTYFRKGNIREKQKRRKNKWTKKPNKHTPLKLWETTAWSPRSDKDEGKRDVLQELEQRFTCRPLTRPQWRRHFPAVCGEDHARADIHTAACGQPVAEQIFS